MSLALLAIAAVAVVNPARVRTALPRVDTVLVAGSAPRWPGSRSCRWPRWPTRSSTGRRWRPRPCGWRPASCSCSRVAWRW